MIPGVADIIVLLNIRRSISTDNGSLLKFCIDSLKTLELLWFRFFKISARQHWKKINGDPFLDFKPKMVN